MIIRAASLSILPERPIFVKVIDRPRIRVTFVEVSDFFCHLMRSRFFSVSSRKLAPHRIRCRVILCIMDRAIIATKTQIAISTQ